MISEALDLFLEGGRVSHSWCMRVVGHGYVGLGWILCMRDKVRGVARNRDMPEHFPSAR